MPQAHSLAKGTGKNGPRNRGGLTLTGELGYEIAWLPSEGRSVILGTTGPQMVNLPADAVIWDHEQSKEIMKRNAIPAGSHPVSGGGSRPNRGGGSNSTTKKSGSSKKKKGGSGGNSSTTHTRTNSTSNSHQGSGPKSEPQTEAEGR